MITKEEADRIAGIEGKIRGSTFQTDAAVVIRLTGGDGLEKVQEALLRLGYPLHYDEIKAMRWYPLGLRTLGLVVIKDVFGWNDEDIKAMGDAAPKYSFIVRLIMKHLISAKVAFEKSPEYWDKHYTIGKIEAGEFNEKRKFAISRLKDFKVHRIYCKYLEGYFGRLMQNLLPHEKVKSEEIKCMFRGDEYHEFKTYWGEHD